MTPEEQARAEGAGRVRRIAAISRNLSLMNPGWLVPAPIHITGEPKQEMLYVAYFHNGEPYERVVFSMN